MAHTDQDNIQNTAAAEVVDVKPEKDKGAARIVLADGQTQDVDASGDFIANIRTRNIIIDPALAEKATRHSGPPLTIAEALERGDFAALSRILEAQSRRAENDVSQHDAESAQQARRDRESAREAELRQYYDEHGGYRDGRGGYYDPNAGTYTDKDGGVVDNYGGYRYTDGSYKSGMGDYYDSSSHTFYGADGSVRQVPPTTTNDQMMEAMQKDAEANGRYDNNSTKRSQAQAADQDHPNKDTPRGANGDPIMPEKEQTAENARNNRGPGLSKPATRKVPFVIPGTASGSKFPAGGTASTGSIASSGADVNGSHFFAVDSSISSSKFTPAPTDITAPQPPADTPVNTDAARPKPPVPKSAAPG